MTIAEQITRAKTDYDEVYEAGKQAEYDKFWDNFQQNGTREYYNYAFAYSGWNDATYNPKYPIICGTGNTDGQNIFRSTYITDTKVPIQIPVNGAALFYSSPTIKTINKLIVTENTNLNNAFYSVYTVENIEIEGILGRDFSMSSCSKLTKKSILSIVNALSTTATDKTLTLNKAAVNNAFETAEGLADGSISEEWLALVNSKPNWTIVI